MAGPFLPGYNQPFPSRDTLVTESRKGTRTFVQWSEQSLLQRVDQTSYRIPSMAPETALQASGSGVLVADAVGGQYRLSVYREVVAADPVSSSLAIVMGFTHNSKALTRSLASFSGAPQTINDNVGDTVVIDVDAGTPITYTATYASNTPGVASFYLSITPQLLQAQE